MMKSTIAVFLLIGACGLPTALPASTSDQAELAMLLEGFLDGASINDAEVHDRFWAEDLIYTSSSGQRFGKDRIMRSLGEGGATESPPAYSARNITIRVFGDTAVVTFRLMAEQGGETTGEYFNTGVFRKREGVWRAVTWQATVAGDVPAGQ